MKPTFLSTAGLGTLCFMLWAFTASAQQQRATTDVPRTISYQGRLSDISGETLPDGQYRITLSLYADPAGSLKVWQDTYDATLTGGIFNLYLGAGTTPLPDLAAMNTQIWIGTQLADGSEMAPLTPLAASPYALNVPDRTVTTAKLADGAVTAQKVDMDYVGAVAINGQTVTGKGSMLNIEGSKDIALDYNGVTNTLRLHRGTPATRGDADKGAGTLAVADAVWSMHGDGWDVSSAAVVTPTPGDWIGTSATSGITFEHRANGQTVMRYQPNGTNAPNIVGGAATNSISAGVISGTIVGGQDNSLGNNGNFGFIGGGHNNSINSPAPGPGNHSVITGGEYNSISGDTSIIGGGSYNSLQGSISTISGGTSNSAFGNQATVAGGEGNGITNDFSSIGGGKGNFVTANESVVAGGGDGITSNFINAPSASIGGGTNNFITPGATGAVIGGGEGHNADGKFSAIPGGNQLRTSSYAQTSIGVLNVTRGASTSMPRGTPAADDPIFMIGNGDPNTIPPTRSNAFEVSYNGHTVAYDINGSSQTAVPSNRAVIKGTTYVDNIIYAWADVNADGTIFDDFGVAAVTMVGPGVYDVDINIKDPQTGTPVTLRTGAVTALLRTEGEAAQCGFIQCSRLSSPTANRFRVFTTGINCDAVNLPFFFKVTGRP